MKGKTTFKFRTVALMLILMLLMAPFAAISAFADGSGTFASGTYNGRNYKVYIPSSYVSGTSVPLMVMLHGGTQDPTAFATGTQMNALAEEENFIVLYPEQPSSANSSKCWNWFLTADQSRGSGEPALIVGMVNQIKSQYSIDNSKVFAAGLSAGAAMSVILGATYPDVFSGIGVASGLEYKAATDMTGAFTAMSSGGPAPATQGQLAYNAMGSYARTVPVIVFQGSSDYTVYPVNGNQVLSQWAKTNDLADDGSANGSVNDTADATYTGTADVANGKSYTRYVYNDSSNNIIMEKYIVTGMGHAWSGGSSSGSYTDPTGPDCSLIMYNFFMSVTGGTTVVDKSQLQSAVNAAAAIDLSLYTTGSAASVTAALSTANAVLADADATQAQVDAAASGLNNAVAALVELTPTVDKSQLQSAVNAAAAIDLSLYTTGSAASVTAALSTANAVLADEDATQAQVDAAASGLNNAVAALVELTPAEGTFISGTYQYRNYKLYVPGSYVSGTAMPMMVMLHAGAQDPDTFASETQMNEQADARGFFVLYPDQPYTANYTKCWNWFLTADQTRGAGEPAIIAGMTTQVMSQYSIDGSRVYVSGLGAGGAMAVIMGATYPDLYSGIGVAEGLEYKAATSTYSAYLSMISGGPSPATQGQLAYNAMGSYADVIPVIVFQGSADTTVYPVNGNQVISQWAKTNDLADDGTANSSIDDTADETITGTVNVPNGKSYTQYIYEDGNGNTVMEKYIVNSMGYAWSGGSASGLKTDPTGPDMTNILCDFFLM